VGAHFAAASKAMDDDYESIVETLKDLAAGLNSMRQGAVKIVTGKRTHHRCTLLVNLDASNSPFLT
jgi:hypothetical protein